jgi:hypothetical protein
VCVRENDLEHISAFTFAILQPSSKAAPEYTVQDAQESALARRVCGQDGICICNIKTQVPSRLFTSKADAIRFTGLALLHMGDVCRVLAPVEYHDRSLQEARKTTFDLIVPVIPSL